MKRKKGTNTMTLIKQEQKLLDKKMVPAHPFSRNLTYTTEAIRQRAGRYNKNFRYLIKKGSRIEEVTNLAQFCREREGVGYQSFIRNLSEKGHYDQFSLVGFSTDTETVIKEKPLKLSEVTQLAKK